MADTLAQVREILSTQLVGGIDPVALTAATPLAGALAALDSLAILSIVIAIEDAFELTIPDEEIDAEVFETVGSLAAFVDRMAASVGAAQ